MTHLKTLLATTLAVLSFSVAAQTAVQITDPWVRATVPQQKATGAFMQITAPKAMRLLEVRSPVAGVAEIHEMSMADNMMRMRQVKDARQRLEYRHPGQLYCQGRQARLAAKLIRPVRLSSARRGSAG